MNLETCRKQSLEEGFVMTDIMDNKPNEKDIIEIDFKGDEGLQYENDEYSMLSKRQEELYKFFEENHPIIVKDHLDKHALITDCNLDSIEYFDNFKLAIIKITTDKIEDFIIQEVTESLIHSI
jgi:hypothetical protein